MKVFCQSGINPKNKCKFYKKLPTLEIFKFCDKRRFSVCDFNSLMHREQHGTEILKSIQPGLVHKNVNLE